MKKTSKLLFAALVGTVIIFTSCGKEVVENTI